MTRLALMECNTMKRINAAKTGYIFLMAASALLIFAIVAQAVYGIAKTSDTATTVLCLVFLALPGFHVIYKLSKGLSRSHDSAKRF
ncbi:hypothetical protein FACS1894204_13240 [Synergistales bacterium]|nr:hypothetical protein FACS1894204_13240 [Synergistales bacterium]